MSQTNTDVQSSSFLNLFGVAVSVVLCTLFIILGGHALKYIKAFAIKVKIISNRAKDQDVQKKDFNYKGPPGKERSQAYLQMEQVFKNEIKKSRSLQLGIIFGHLMAKYNHLVYYPFRDRISEQYNLLKPKTSFYTLLVVCSACIAWMTTIFLSAIIQQVYSDITTVPLGVFIGLTIVICLVSSILNFIATNRLFNVYLVTMKAAFKVNYGKEFVDAHQNLGEYEPNNEIEKEELLSKAEGSHLTRVGGDQEESKKLENILKNSVIDQPTQRTMREETHLNSTRKLLGEEFEKSDKAKLLISQASQHEQTIIEENKEEDLEDGPESYKYGEAKKGKRLRDIFDMQVEIEGAYTADPDKKYIFIEDTAHIGDIDLLENEASKGENHSMITTFVVLFIVIAGAAIFCCYLNYNFSEDLSRYVFYMFAGGFIGDLLVTRVFFLFLAALFTMCKGAVKGYKKVEYKSSKDIKDVMGKAIKEMFDQRKKMREQQQTQVQSGDQYHLIHKGKAQNLSQEDMMNMQDYMTQNAFERDESRQFKDFEDNKEDNIAQVMSNKRDDDQDGQRNPIFNLQRQFHPTDFARPQIEQKNLGQDSDQKVAFAGNGVSFMSKLKNAVQDKEDEKYSNIMEKKNLTNDLVDYNLLLLRKIYDAYEDKAEKVIKNFRSDKHGILRKRYMVPILNPNYDYEKLLREMQMKPIEKLAAEQDEENSVHLDGITVCEDYEKQLMEAIIQEASDDLVPKNVGRRRIDKFGNPIDHDKEYIKTTLMPAYGKIELTLEENMIEDDEDSRRRALLELYWRREDDGESFNKEETSERDELESWRLKQLEDNIQRMTQNGFDQLSDQDKLTVVMDKRQHASILLRQLRRKKNLTDEEKELMQRLERQCLELEYQELQLKEKLGVITEDEKKRLHDLERIFDFEEIEKLRNIMLQGKITPEELKRLRFLEKKWGLDHMKNPFEDIQEENHDEENLFEEEEPLFMEEDSRHSGITEEENFAELPPVHVMNNTSKPQSPNKALDEQNRLEREERMKQELLEKERLEELERERLAELERQRLLEEERLREAQELDQKMRDEEERLRQEMEAQRLRQESEQLALMEEEEKLMKQKEEMEQRLRDEEEERLRMQEELNRLNEEKLEQFRQQQELEERQRQELEAQYASQKSKLDNEEDLIRQRLEELLEKQRNGTLTEEELEELRRLQEKLEDIMSQKEELLSARGDELKRQQEEDERRRLEEQEILRQQELAQKQLEEEELARSERLKEEQDELLRQQRELDEKLRLQQLEQDEALRKQQELEDLERQRKELEQEEQERLRKLQELQDLEEAERKRLEASFNRIDNSAIERRSGSSIEGMSRIGSRKQDRMNQQLLNNMEDEDVMRNTKYNDPEYAFGHDDLEPAPGAQEESIYSHKTTTILDEEKVSFMHIEQLPNQDNASDDSFSEQDMVYYNKDDLTNYSKGLGLNKIKAKNPQQNYFSENDLYEVEEGELSENDSRRSGRSFDHAGRRNQYGRGKIQHNPLEIQDQSEYIEGRVKVDAWNLNYRGKKKKLKKKKKQVTDNQKRKMDDLQNIYGIDAKTLAGLSKGRLPRQLLASGKLKGDGYPEDTRQSDMSFRSTQNTFMKPHQSTAAKSGLRQSVNDAQSNMFSFNGYGTSKRWNDIESTLKGGPKDSRIDAQASQFDKMSQQRFQGGKKLTQTQENFAKMQAMNGKTPFSPNELLEEESKSGHSGSRPGSLSRQFGQKSNQALAGQKQGQFQGKGGNKNNQQKAKGSMGNKGGKGNKNRRGSSDGIDSHSESDEAVDDKGAMFQKRNGPWNMNGGRPKHAFGSMNELENRSGSDEENNQENPDFSGNQFAFKKRDNDDLAANQRLKQGADNALNQRQGSKNRNGQGSFNDMSMEDLEAQNFSNKKGRTGQKKGNQDGNSQLRATNKSGKGSAFGPNDMVFLGDKSGSKNLFGSTQNVFESPGKKQMRQGSAERDDSEDENLGGEVLFQKRNPRGDYANAGDVDAMNVSGVGSHNRNASNGNLNKSSSKPPLSGRKQHRGARGGDDGQTNHIYGDPYNINGVFHPGVSENVRNKNFGYPGQSEHSDNDARMRGTFNGSDRSNSNSAQRKGNQGLNRLGASNGFSSNPNLLSPHDQNVNSKGSKRGGRKQGGRSNGNNDDVSDYIVGPESNHSKLKKKPRDNMRGSSNDNEEEKYMLLQRERQIVEDIESERNLDGDGKLAKKRKIKRAAHSQNPRDAQTLKYREQQQERLRRKQREAEAALFAQADDDDLEKGQAKLKKKTKKKEWVKKEVNYWLDYDSPYAEYLVARFREWSPNPNLHGGRGSSAGSSQKVKGVSQKYQEMSTVYNKDSKQNSRSRERRFGNEGGSTLNVTNQKKAAQQSNSKTRQQKDGNTLSYPFNLSILQLEE